MKAPYPCDRQNIAFLHQTFAFISEVEYDDITFIDTWAKLISFLLKMHKTETNAGRSAGRAFDFAITKNILIKWDEADPNSGVVFNWFIWVGDQAEERHEDGSFTTYYAGKGYKLTPWNNPEDE